MPDIKNARILILATDGFEQSELEVPLDELRKAGARVDVAAPAHTLEPRQIRGWAGTNWGRSVPVDRSLDDVAPADYDALVLPGGQMNPDKLRMEAKAVDLVRAFVDKGKVVAAICHGPWMLAEADVLDGREVTSWPSIRTDLLNAGADWRDEEVVTDEGLITSRSPKDLTAFVAKIIEEVQESHGEHARLAASPVAPTS